MQRESDNNLGFTEKNVQSIVCLEFLKMLWRGLNLQRKVDSLSSIRYERLYNPKLADNILQLPMNNTT
jgi:hypothetical protein